MENGVSLSKDITLTAGNNWTASWGNLPVYKNGVEIKYSVVEDTASMPASYSQKSSVIQKQSDGTYLAVITNQYSMDKVSHTVTKVWDDNNNRDGLRTPITVRLIADGTAVTDPEASEQNFEVISEPSLYVNFAAAEKINLELPENYTRT